MGSSTRETARNARLKDEQRTRIIEKAAEKQKKLIAQARQRVPEGVQEGQGLFFLMLFQLAGESIENDVDSFCDRAETAFEEIEAFGQEPTIDEDWLGEVTGDRDTFNFSTENLVSDLVTLPRRKRRQREVSQEERERLREEVEAAILDDEPQDYQQALATAHAENVTEWIEAIKTALRKSEDGILEFWRLRGSTGLLPAELFLGLLLGQQHWEIGQKHFYGKVTVRMREKDRQEQEG